MLFRLTKHHGLGNDFLVHLSTDGPAATDRAVWVERAQRWCDRRRGIGADGLLIGLVDDGPTSGPGVDLEMLLVNADGSIAEMSGNGIRCLAQAAALAGLGDRSPEGGVLVIDTDAGVRTVTFQAPSEHLPSTMVASVDMGPAGPGPEADRPVDITVDDVDDATAAALALAPLRSATFDLGNPHLVLLVPDPDVVDLVAAGSTHESTFDSGINVHFIAASATEPDVVEMRVWERGAGITEACGTGATAVARAAHDWGLTGTHVEIRMPGGSVQVDVADSMTLHGPATYIASIEVHE